MTQYVENHFDSRKTGFYQVWLLGLFWVIIIATHNHTVIIDHVATSPSWQHVDQRINTTTQPSSSRDRCQIPRDAWEYTESKYFSLVTEYDLVCTKEWMLEFAKSAIFLGWSAGALAFIWVINKFGRKHTLFMSYTLFLLLTLSSIASPTINVYLIFRVLIGFLNGGIKPTISLFVTELVGFRSRPFAVSIMYMSDGLSYVYVALHSYFINSWKMLYLALVIPFSLVIFCWPLVLESPAWTGNDQEVVKEILLTIDARNGHPEMPFYSPVSGDLDKSGKEGKSSISCSRPALVKLLLLMFVIFSSGCLFMGITFLSPDMALKKISLGYALSGFSEIPGCLLAMLMCKRLGRKQANLWSCLLSALFCIIIAFIPSNDNNLGMRLTFGFGAKLCITCFASVLLTWVMELYDDSHRASISCCFDFVVRIAHMLSPWFTSYLARINKTVPYIAICLIALLACLVMLFIPDTALKSDSNSNNMAQNETIQNLKIKSATIVNQLNRKKKKKVSFYLKYR